MKRIAEELRKTVRHPSRVLKLADPKRREAFRDARAPGSGWTETGGFRVRTYRSYDDYVRHQSAKVHLKGDLSEYDRRFREALRDRILGDPEIPRATSVLCLAARIGTEVKAFLDAGCFAVGIDLNPAGGEGLVLRGDFHDLPFADGSVQAVFTNSLDHSLDVDRVLAEVRRVLVPGGLLIVEAMRGEREGKGAGQYESFHWETIDALVERIESSGLALTSRRAIDRPWPGEHLRFRSAARAAPVPD